MNLPMMGIVALFLALIVGFYFYNKQRERLSLRDIPAYYRLGGAVEVAVEDGTRIHVAIGPGHVADKHPRSRCRV